MTINLQPYANPAYFVYLIGALIPLMIGLWYGKRFRIYETIISFIFLWLTFGGPKYREGIALIAYICWQLLVIYLYFTYRQKKNTTPIFILAVFLAILPLIFVKVTPFLTMHPSILGFLGISYLTFKSVQMVMETRDGIIKKFDLAMLIHFLLFFPTISSGPIDRYRRFEKDYATAPTRDQYLNFLEKGIWNIFLGFFYKFILGYLFGTVMLPRVEHLALARHTIFSLPVAGYMYTYSMYLFFDFAGYSLFAIGISYLMGVNTPINFNKPFLSWNIKEFWNRWHMTLSFWFRDYIYMRLVFFMMKHKIIKSKIWLANIGYLTLFLIMGIWHGLTWYYIVYGLYHALAIILTDVWLRFKKKHKEQIPSNKFTKGLAVFLTFNLVCVSFLIFSGFLNKLWFI